MKRKPILIDLDETVYPFLSTWDKWMKHTNRGAVDYDAFVWYYDLDLYLSNHVEKTPDFIAYQHILEPQPIPEAMTALLDIAEYYPIMALTARNKADWSNATDLWVEQHLPFVKDIHYVRENRGDDAIPKGIVASQLNAQALIDDTAYWIDSLPTDIDGYIVTRPQPIASDNGAEPWHLIADKIIGR